MNILVLGGSYFLGKHFVEAVYDKHSVTVFNRGSRPINIEGVRELKGDRHCEDDLKQLRNVSIDVVVDFCGYAKGDIESVLSVIGKDVKQYIFISTVDVYQRGLERVLDENSPFETRDFGGEVGAYILGKVALENELATICQRYGVKYTSIRPAFIYGPDNYAPREGIYFTWMTKAGQIIHPVDATGEFQLVYVGDVVNAIINSLQNEAAYDEAFNITSPKIENYESFAHALESISPCKIDRVNVSIDSVASNNIPLPFPLTRQESNWYSADKSLLLVDEYTDLATGLRSAADSHDLYDSGCQN